MMEEVKETKVEEPRQQPPKKKKSRALYWIVVIVGAVFIFVASYNIGYKLGRLVETNNGSTKTESKEESNSNNNETSNVESNVNSNETSNTVEIEKKDAAYFDEYLKYFTLNMVPSVTDNTENFTDEDICNFLMSYALINNKTATEKDQIWTLVLPASEVDGAVYKYFNVKEYKLTSNVTSEDSLVRIRREGNNYVFNWGGFSGGQGAYTNPVVTYNGINVTVKYDIIAFGEIVAKDTFHLRYNNGNYNLIKVESVSYME